MCVCLDGYNTCCSKTGVEVSDLSPACLCGSGKNCTGVHASKVRTHATDNENERSVRFWVLEEIFILLGHL